MIINLKNIHISDLLKGDKWIVLYGDFYVLNYLYENQLVYNSDIIIYPDSTAVHIILKLFNVNKLIELVSTDLQEELLNRAALMKKKIFLFGGTDDVLNKIRDKMKARSIDIAGTVNGYVFNDESVCKKINSSCPDILFVGLGVTRQEKWIGDNYKKLNVPLIISVGGWFQYLGGVKKRPPLILRKLHLEWLYKFCREFRRVWKRYLIILPLFMLRIITGKIKVELEQ